MYTFGVTRLLFLSFYLVFVVLYVKNIYFRLIQFNLSVEGENFIFAQYNFFPRLYRFTLRVALNVTGHVENLKRLL